MLLVLEHLLGKNKNVTTLDIEDKINTHNVSFTFKNTSSWLNLICQGSEIFRTSSDMFINHENFFRSQGNMKMKILCLLTLKKTWQI